MLHYLKTEADAENGRSFDAEISNVSRRGVLGGLLTATGLVLAVRITPASAREALKPYPTGGLTMPDGVVADPHVFIAIAPDGALTIVTHRSEMGTGIRTSLPMVVADEMGADSIWVWDHFYPLYGDPDAAHFEAYTLLAAMAADTANAHIGVGTRSSK